MRHAPLPLELLRSGFAVRLRVTGRSMIPYFADNDVVTLEPVDAADIRFGDVVYTQQPGLPPLLHRVIARVPGSDGRLSLLTKGDANRMADAAARAEHVAGRAVTISRVLSTGARRVVRLESRRQQLLQRGLAFGSRHAPRSFAAISRRLVPPLLRLAAYVRRTL